jgi:hypothetical protein
VNATSTDEVGLVNYADRLAWVNALKKNWIGDADLTLKFECADLINVFTVCLSSYPSQQAASSWALGSSAGA